MALHSLETPAKIRSQMERMDALIATPQQVNLRLNGKRLHSEHWANPNPETRINFSQALPQAKERLRAN